VLGGGMRQAGIVAAAGILALTTHVERLAVDHENAAILADGLSGIEGLSIDRQSVKTNMVFVSLKNGDARELKVYLKKEGVLINSGDPIRLVTHLDVDASNVAAAVDAFKKYFSKK
jgi:threonine aldolase